MIFIWLKNEQPLVKMIKIICLHEKNPNSFATVLLTYLSRKAEGNGPMKPWQPLRILERKKVPTPSLSRRER